MNRHKISDASYTDRNHEVITIKRVDPSTRGEEYCTVTTTNNSGFGVPLMHTALRVGGEYTLECKGFNSIAGLLENGNYLFRRTDEYFTRQHEEFQADHARRQRENLEKNRDDYRRRENLLSSPWKSRLARFHEDPTFELEGWGYELVICELGQLMASGDEEAVQAYADREGVSGNQYGCAKALAERLNREDFHRVPAGLAPLGATW